MRLQLILNPQADRGRAQQWAAKLAAWGRPYGELSIAITSAPGEGVQLAAAAAADGVERVIAAGGDGTVHEVINGLMSVPADRRPALGLLPIGSGNDYAYGLDAASPAPAAFERFVHGTPRRLDLALLTVPHRKPIYVCNGIGIGLDAAVAIASTRIKRLYGFPAYLLAALQTIALHYERPTLSVRFDEEHITQQALLLGIGIGPRIGGGFYLTPDAIPDDGLLDSCLVDPVNRLTMLQTMPKVMKGSHVKEPFVTMRRHHTLHLTADQPLPVHADGEIIAFPADDVRALTIESLPGALLVVL